MSISVITPTVGRPSLHKLISQLIPQLEAEDEIIVVADGPVEAAGEIVKSFPQARYFEHPLVRGWGGTLRTFAMSVAKGSHFHFLDDDDESVPGALNTIRAAILQNPEHIHIFRAYHESSYLWQKPEITVGNISTQMFIVPNDEILEKTWSDIYEGDFFFISENVKKRGEDLVLWHEEVIAAHNGVRGTQVSFLEK